MTFKITLFSRYLPFLKSSRLQKNDLRVVVVLMLLFILVVQLSCYCNCLLMLLLCMSRTVCLLFSVLLVNCFSMLEQKQCCSCSCCFVLLFQKRKKTRQDKTREEELRRDRTSGEEVMLLQFDQYLYMRF